MPQTSKATATTSSRDDQPPLQRADAIAEISRQWLAGIDPHQFGGFHEYLLAVRLARHMSKTDVVNASMIDGDPATGVSLPTVSKIETGAYGEPGFRTMVRLSRGYGIAVTPLQLAQAYATIGALGVARAKGGKVKGLRRSHGQNALKHDPCQIRHPDQSPSGDRPNNWVFSPGIGSRRPSQTKPAQSLGEGLSPAPLASP